MNARNESNKRLSILPVVTNYFAGWRDFRGRSSRAEYWGSVFFVFIVGVLSFCIFPSLETIWMLATLLPLCAVTVRRLNDAGRTWKSLFWLLLPFVGPIVLFTFLLLRSKGTAKGNLMPEADPSSERPAHCEEDEPQTLPCEELDVPRQGGNMAADTGEAPIPVQDDCDEDAWLLRYRVLNALSRVTHAFAMVGKILFKVLWLFTKYFVIVAFRLWRVLWGRNRRAAVWVLSLFIFFVIGAVGMAIEHIGAGLAWLGSEEARWIRISGVMLLIVAIGQIADWAIQRVLQPMRQMKARFDASVQQGQALFEQGKAMVEQGRGLVAQGKAFADTAKGIKTAFQGKDWAGAIRQGTDLAQQGQSIVNEAKGLKAQGQSVIETYKNL